MLASACRPAVIAFCWIADLVLELEWEDFEAFDLLLDLLDLLDLLLDLLLEREDFYEDIHSL